MVKNSELISSKLYNVSGEYNLFKDISQFDLDAVLGCIGARVVNYAKNAYVLLDMDDVTSTGLLLEGNIAMVKEDEHGHQSLITYFEEGDLFGESFSLARDHTSSVSLRTMTKCTVMYLSVGKILNTCENNCQFHKTLIANLFDCISKKNVSLMHKIDVISRGTIRERILTYLKVELDSLNRVKKTPKNRKIIIPLNKTEMAQYLCVNRSSLLRELAAMKKDGLIDVTGRTFTLLK